MKHTLYKEADYKTSEHMGGTARELAVFPDTAEYLNRDFIWRISVDSIESEESDFSRLPDYDRVLLILEGETVLSYEGQRVARLAPLEQDRFDGSWKTRSFGKIRGFNLMVRKGCDGFVDVIFPKEESSPQSAPISCSISNTTHALFCEDGYCLITKGTDSIMVREGQLLTLEFEEGEKAEYSVMGEGTVIRSVICYDDMQGQVGPEIIPAEKASFDDFKCCVYLANVQFKLAKYMLKSLKTTWFDQALSKAIRKIERFYIPMIVFFIGAMAIGIYAAQTFSSEAAVLISILVWLAIDSILITPLMYMLVVPKPVRKHIKKVENLTPYEQRVREEELGSNERLEKVLKKYKNSGKNLGRDE